MKGVIFNLFEDFISEGWGDEAYEAVLASCPLHTKEPFVGPGTYPDADLLALVAKATERLGVPADAAVRAFGKFCLPKLVQKFPRFVAGHRSAKSFLMSVHDVIHVEVRKLFKDAVTPAFRYEDPGPDRLVIHYSSPRKLCYLMEGLLDGVADHFKTTISYRQERCALEGGDVCEFYLEFATR